MSMLVASIALTITQLARDWNKPSKHKYPFTPLFQTLHNFSDKLQDVTDEIDLKGKLTLYKQHANLYIS